MPSRQNDSLNRVPAERNLWVGYDVDVHFKRRDKPLILITVRKLLTTSGSALQAPGTRGNPLGRLDDARLRSFS